VIVTPVSVVTEEDHRKNLQKNSSVLSVIEELIADGEKAFHPTDRFGDYAVRFSGLKLVF
jgi:hypothetical protein